MVSDSLLQPDMVISVLFSAILVLYAGDGDVVGLNLADNGVVCVAVVSLVEEPRVDELL